jgi:hypothetical protein
MQNLYSDYFTGRIAKVDRETAEVRLIFGVGNISSPVFSSRELSALNYEKNFCCWRTLFFAILSLFL